MSLQIQRTISLIKKSYDQPIIFHILYSHLASLLKKTNAEYQISDDWSKIIILGCSTNKLPQQGLEIKLLNLLKKIRPPLASENNKLKLMCICYYILNRPTSLINNLILFELVSNFMGISDYFDGFIITILNKIVTAKAFGVPENTKIQPVTIQRMVSIIYSVSLSNINKIKALPCFIKSDNSPFSLGFLEISPDLLGFKCLEYICFYVKFAQNTGYIKDILPSDPGFVPALSNYMQNNFEFESNTSIIISDCQVENREIFDQLKRAFELSNNKSKFIIEISEFISNLN